MTTLTKVSNVLGGKKVLGKEIKTQMDLVELGKEGIPKSAILSLLNAISLSLSQVEEILPISNRTLQRYNAKEHLAQAISEQALQIAEVISRGEEVFHDKNKFMEWLKRPNIVFNGKTPLSLLGSIFGREMIMDELGRMETGVYS